MAPDDNMINATLFAFDSDADGMLTSSEVLMAQLSFGAVLNNEESERFKNKIGDSNMTYKAASELIKDAIKNHNPEKELETLVRPFDVSKDGTISLSEMAAVFNTLSTRVTGEKALSLAHQFSDGDRLRYKEFFNFLLQ